MDIKAYISSGIVETYVMGMASEHEVREVETLAAQYPEVRDEILSIELALEKLAIANSVAPPAALRENIFAAIEKEVSATNTQNKPVEQNVAETKVISISKNTKSVNWFAIAASVALLVSLAYNYNQNKKIEYSNKVAAQALDSLCIANKEIENKLALEKEITDKNIALFTQAGNKIIEMKGLPISPSSLALVVYNANTKQAFINVKSLPQTPAEKQYQLWAIVDGKPVDMGVFDVNTNTNILQKMLDVTNPQAFAVTLENKGGSPTPTMEQMFVMGKSS